MTAGDFVTWAQGYYGPYPVGQRADVAEYLGYLSSAMLDEMKIQMRATCPSHINQVNGYPPDINRMEELLPEVIRVIRAKEREARELEHTARLLLTAESQPATHEEMMAIDWSQLLRRAMAGNA